ncbi:MAG: hypothetical protein IPM12_13485 [Flavobacteriales bacterium]|nr:hypothetical protein [Flavobacteriales bacterium]
MRRRGWKRWLLRAALAWVLFVALVSVALHPYWAVTRTSGSCILVVEGWMHDQGLEAAAERFKEGGYERIVVTGTVRPLAYYLMQGDTLTLGFPSPRDARIDLRMAGSPMEAIVVQADGRPILHHVLGMHEEALHASARALGSIRIIVAMPGAMPASHAAAFLKELRINGANAHADGIRVSIAHADGTRTEGTPTYAHQSKQKLIGLGIDKARITVLPSWKVERSKTYSAARDMDAHARANGIAAYDVATLAVHARRTWKMHRIARQGSPVGIVALDDPWCHRWSWWGNYYGWYQVIKESIALPAPWLVDRLSEEKPEVSVTAPR